MATKKTRKRAPQFSFKMKISFCDSQGNLVSQEHVIQFQGKNLGHAMTKAIDAYNAMGFEITSVTWEKYE